MVAVKKPDPAAALDLEILQRLRWANGPITLALLFRGFRPRWAADALARCEAAGTVRRDYHRGEDWWELTEAGVAATDAWAAGFARDRGTTDGGLAVARAAGSRAETQRWGHPGPRENHRRPGR